MWSHELEALEKQVAENSYTRDAVPHLVQAVRDAWTSCQASRIHIRVKFRRCRYEPFNERRIASSHCCMPRLQRHYPT